MRRGSALFDSTDVEDGVFEVHLLPTQVNQFGGLATVSQLRLWLGGSTREVAAVEVPSYP